VQPTGAEECLGKTAASKGSNFQAAGSKAMSTQTTIPIAVLHSLTSHRSRASAVAVGHHFVLNGVPPVVQMKGIEALSNMVCDWAVAILEEFITDPLRNYLVRKQATRQVSDLVIKAIERGYRGISRDGADQLTAQALEALSQEGTANREEAVERLCGHLSRAVEEGCFGSLPDF